MTNTEWELLKAYFKMLEQLEKDRRRTINNGRGWKVFDVGYPEPRQNKKEVRSIELWLKLE